MNATTILPNTVEIKEEIKKLPKGKWKQKMQQFKTQDAEKAVLKGNL